jgi:TRAP-type uncharacterized transport system substrate-binding protein
VRIAVGPTGTPEAYLAQAVIRIAQTAGITLEPKRFDGGEARRVASVHEGMSEVSIALAETLRWTYRAEGAYDGWRHTSLRTLAAIYHPLWLGIAARWESGIAKLEDLASARNLRLLAPLRGGESATWSFVADQVLAAHGAPPAELIKRDWRVEDIAKAGARVRNLDFDVIVAPLGAPGSVHAQLWHEASVRGNLRFLPIDDPLRDRLASDAGVRCGAVPANYLRGLDASVQTVAFDRWMIFASERLEDDVAIGLARALENGRQSLVPLHAFLDATASLEDARVPVHRAVLKDRQERGLTPALAASQ